MLHSLVLPTCFVSQSATWIMWVSQFYFAINAAILGVCRVGRYSRRRNSIDSGMTPDYAIYKITKCAAISALEGFHVFWFKRPKIHHIYVSKFSETLQFFSDQ